MYLVQNTYKKMPGDTIISNKKLKTCRSKGKSTGPIRDKDQLNLKDSCQSLKKSMMNNCALTSRNKDGPHSINFKHKLSEGSLHKKTRFQLIDRPSSRNTSHHVKVPSRDKSNSKINVSVHSIRNLNKSHVAPSNTNNNLLQGSPNKSKNNASSSKLLSQRKKKELITQSAHKFNNVTINNTYQFHLIIYFTIIYIILINLTIKLRHKYILQ